MAPSSPSPAKTTMSLPFAHDVPGAHIVSWYQKLFDNATTFASILASVMFSVTVSDLKPANLPQEREPVVRRQSAIGAILFVFLVLLCQSFSLLLKFHGTLLARAYNKKIFPVRALFALVSLAFHQLLLVGTLFFCLVLRSYVPSVGHTAFWITLALVIISFAAWFAVVCIELHSQCGKWFGSGDWVSAQEAEAEQKAADLDAYTKGRGVGDASTHADSLAALNMLVEALRSVVRIEEGRARPGVS